MLMKPSSCHTFQMISQQENVLSVATRVVKMYGPEEELLVT